MFDVYVKEKVVKEAENYFSALAKKHLEGMGLLLGEVCEHRGESFVIVEGFTTANTNSTAVSVRFSQSAFASIAQELKQMKDQHIVGWCHSHPSYGCFLSSTDVSTQRRFFNELHHVAAVFDPLRSEKFGNVQAMAKRFYRLNGNGYGINNNRFGNEYEEISFAVIK